jgi:hypothetical protein
MPATSITFAHFADSARIYAPNACGESPTTVAPISLNFARTSCSAHLDDLAGDLAEIVASPPGALAALVKSDMTKYGKLIREIGVRAN